MKFELPTTLHTLVFAYILALFCALSNPLLLDPDTPLHIYIGDLIRAHQALPTTDPWSFTAKGYPWLIIAWGWDVLMSIGFEYLGEAGLHLLLAALYGFLHVLLLDTLLRKPGISIGSALLTLMFVSWVLLDYMSARPHWVSLYMALLFYRALDRSYQSHKISASTWIYLAVLMMIWVNLHGGFFVAFSIFGAFGLTALWEKQRAYFLSLVALSTLCLAAILVNPLGIQIFEATGRSLHSVITPHINEWGVFLPNAHNIELTSFVVLCLLLLRPAVPNVPLHDRILGLLWCVAALFGAVRHFGFFALFAAPYVASQLQGTGHMRRFIPVDGRAQRVVALLFAVLILMLQWKGIPTSQEPRGRSEAGSPEITEISDAAIEYVNAKLSNLATLNNYENGGTLVFKTQGRHKIFIDSRAGTAYPESVLAEYLILQSPGDWAAKEKILAQYQIDAAVVSPLSPLAKIFQTEEARDVWKQAFSDKTAEIYLRSCHEEPKGCEGKR